MSREGRCNNGPKKMSLAYERCHFKIAYIIIGGAGEKVVAVARAPLVAGKEDRISALPSPQGLLGLLGLGLCVHKFHPNC